MGGADWILMFCNLLLMLMVAFFPFSAGTLSGIINRCRGKAAGRTGA
jgi:hypothetical protein